MKLGYYILLHMIIQNGRENGRMAIDAIIFAALTVLCMVGVCWIIGKIHPFEQVAWSRRKE
jgi:heme/copper-type cytochrome/quinol oxidase subunit 4